MDIDKQVIKLFKQGIFDNIEWTSYPNKYDDQYLSFVDGWNFPVANLNDNVLGDKKELKEILQQFYNTFGMSQTAKASDINQYFETKRAKIPTGIAGKYDEGLELLKLKDNLL